jgi:hypothetical protein
MTSTDTKQQRLKDSQLARARAMAGIDTTDPNVEVPAAAVLADPVCLSHNNSYGRLPRFYIDLVIQCRNCGTQELWSAERQKWWYEVRKGNINTGRYCAGTAGVRRSSARQKPGMLRSSPAEPAALSAA